MELTDTIVKRQSIRKFKDIDVPEEDIKTIIEASSKAPSGKNIQNWHFVAIKNKELKEKIREAIRTKNEEIVNRMALVDEEKAERFLKFARNFTLFAADAPVLIIVFATDYTPSGYLELKFLGADESLTDDLKGRKNPGMQSIGAAVTILSLKAVELGYGTCYMTSANYAGALIQNILKEEEVFCKDDYYMCAMVPLGVPEEGAKSPGRKSLEEIYTFVK